MPKATPKKKALDALCLYKRISMANDDGYCRCVTCDNWFMWNNCQGGHFISRSHSSFWALREENVWPQCAGCNGFGMKFGTSNIDYTLFMQDMLGADFVKDMLATKKNSIKFYKKDYEEMTKEWNKEIKFHKDRIGI